jgi:hypothetical protein
VQPIQIDNRSGDNGASNFSLQRYAQRCAQAFNGGFNASLLGKR